MIIISSYEASKKDNKKFYSARSITRNSGAFRPSVCKVELSVSRTVRSSSCHEFSESAGTYFRAVIADWTK